MIKLKEKVQTSKRCKGLYDFLKKMKHYYIRTIIYNMKLYLRSIGIANLRYKNLKTKKDIHNNERCFIIATGPSLTMDDLNKLRNEKTFGMNSLCKIFGQMGWETTYYGIQDYLVYDKLKIEISNIKKSIVLIGDRIKESKQLDDRWCVYPLHMLNHAVTYDELTAKFSEDCYKAVYDGYTITYSLIQIAVYMGFKEIYLIGCDCNYSDNKEEQHFISSGVFDSSYKTAGNRMIFAYKKAKEYADKHDVKIFNATRGGMLEVFQRVDLDEVLEFKEKK